MLNKIKSPLTCDEDEVRKGFREHKKTGLAKQQQNEMEIKYEGIVELESNGMGLNFRNVTSSTNKTCSKIISIEKHSMA